MVMMITMGRMVMVTRMMIKRDLAKGPQQILEITVPLFSLRSGPSISFYHR